MPTRLDTWQGRSLAVLAGMALSTAVSLWPGDPLWHHAAWAGDRGRGHDGQGRGGGDDRGRGRDARGHDNARSGAGHDAGRGRGRSAYAERNHRGHDRGRGRERTGRFDGRDVAAVRAVAPAWRRGEIPRKADAVARPRIVAPDTLAVIAMPPAPVDLAAAGFTRSQSGRRDDAIFARRFGASERGWTASFPLDWLPVWLVGGDGGDLSSEEEARLIARGWSDGR